MASTRLFHTLVLAGAALVSAPLLACGGDTGTGSTQDPSTSTDPEGSDDPSPDLGKPVGKPGSAPKTDGSAPPKDAGADTGWAPTK